VSKLLLSTCAAAVVLFAFAEVEARAEGRWYGGYRRPGYVQFNWNNPGYFFPRHVYRPYAIYNTYPVHSYSLYPTYPVAPVNHSFHYAPHFDQSNNVYIGPTFIGAGGY
jgi:hypothetical protein